jgi:hypothetical protein
MEQHKAHHALGIGQFELQRLGHPHRALHITPAQVEYAYSALLAQLNS